MAPKGETELGISYEDRNGYLYAFFSGKRNGLEDARRYWLAAIEECNRRGYKRLLVEQYFVSRSPGWTHFTWRKKLHACPSGI